MPTNTKKKEAYRASRGAMDADPEFETADICSTGADTEVVEVVLHPWVNRKKGTSARCDLDRSERLVVPVHFIRAQVVLKICKEVQYGLALGGPTGLPRKPMRELCTKCELFHICYSIFCGMHVPSTWFLVAGRCACAPTTCALSIWPSGYEITSTRSTRPRTSTPLKFRQNARLRNTYGDFGK
jgi:hypothetical protein